MKKNINLRKTLAFITAMTMIMGTCTMTAFAKNKGVTITAGSGDKLDFDNGDVKVSVNGGEEIDGQVKGNGQHVDFDIEDGDNVLKPGDVITITKDGKTET
ncbi:MAG: hypothetical protein IKU80_01790, partial [Firmicutes bacterium]|nr:hypothetical protein [Bacillota bacterium]